MEQDSLYIRHILDAIGRIEAYISGKTKETFLNDRVTADAVAFQIGVIGELAGKVSADGQAKYPDIPWYKITGMRNRLFHDYLGTDWEVVWETVITAISALKAELLKQGYLNT